MEQLAQGLGLAAPLPSVVDLHRLDLFELTGSLFADPASFGMSDVTSACAADPACIAAPSTTFFWDGLHPTSAGHAVIANFALTQLVPAPGTLVLLLAGVLALSGTRIRAGAIRARRRPQSQRRTRFV